MTTYLIFTRTASNPYRTYFQNARKNQKSHEAQGKEEMLKKVEELRAEGETVLSVRTALGSWVNI